MAHFCIFEATQNWNWTRLNKNEQDWTRLNRNEQVWTGMNKSVRRDLWLWLRQGGLQKTDARRPPPYSASYLCSPRLLCAMHSGSKWRKSAKNNFPCFWKYCKVTNSSRPLLPICAPHGYCALCTVAPNGKNPPKIILLVVWYFVTKIVLTYCEKKLF